MKNILNKYFDCNKFSLTIRVNGYKISEEDFNSAINKREIQTKEEIRQKYEQNKKLLVDCPEFEQLYKEIKQECKILIAKKIEKST